MENRKDTLFIQPFLSCSKSTIPPKAEWEGAANPEPEDLPVQMIIIQLSGERLEDISV
jgi:hypothetical protein